MRGWSILAFVTLVAVHAACSDATDEGWVFEPDLLASHETVDFGTVEVGESATATVTIANIGVANAYFLPIQTQDDNFRVAATPSGPLEPGNRIALLVLFEPLRAGVYRDAMTVTSNGDQRVEVELIGTGTTSGR